MYDIAVDRKYLNGVDMSNRMLRRFRLRKFQLQCIQDCYRRTQVTIGAIGY